MVAEAYPAALFQPVGGKVRGFAGGRRALLSCLEFRAFWGLGSGMEGLSKFPAICAKILNGCRIGVLKADFFEA